MKTIWKQVKENNYHHTAETKYVTDGYVIWKGRYRVFSCIHSANEWHLTRLSDNTVLWSARTAKACKENFEYAINRGW